MRTRHIGLNWLAVAGAATVLVAGLSANVMAQDQTRDQIRDQAQDRDRVQDQIYGSQLMTLQERTEYRAKMRALKTAQEREAYRLAHHQQMQARARAQGVTLPDEPPVGGMGVAPGPAAGSGSGMGGGAGSGMGGGAGPGGKK